MRAGIASVVCALLIVLASYAAVVAHNWGAGITDGSTLCDTSTLSECTADDSDSHRVWIHPDLPAEHSLLNNALENSIVNDYRLFNEDLQWWEVYAFEHADSSTADVKVYYQLHANSALPGWEKCGQNSVKGWVDTDTMWCRPHKIIFNSKFADSFDVQVYRRWITCHELGHTLGLQHTFGSSSSQYNHEAPLQSCMRQFNSIDNMTTDLTQHDKSHLLDCYPHDLPVRQPPCWDSLP